METSALGIQPLIYITIFMIWALVWKGIALWKSARSERKIWFIILLIVNTVGLLEIIYIFIIHPRLNKKLKNKKDMPA